MTARMVLHAIGKATRISGSHDVHFGTRSFSIGACADYTTVAAHLRLIAQLFAPPERTLLT